jgi:predicted methyltransferase
MKGTDMRRTSGTLTFTALLAFSASTGLLAAPDDVESLRSALSTTDRAESDRARDAGRKPADVVSFLGIAPGMTVIDLIAASGYYTEVLSIAVGPTGKVYAQNGALVLQFRDGANDKAITARLANDRLPNVIRWDREIADLGLEANSFDAALTALNFHDIYNAAGPEAAAGFLMAVYQILEPGGVLGIIDHSGAPDADNSALHRIEERLVIAAAEAAGFTVEAHGEFLHNANDPRTAGVFDPSVRGHTDRFLLRLRKPAED